MDEINSSAGDDAGESADHDRDERDRAAQPPTGPLPTAPGDVDDDDWMPV